MRREHIRLLAQARQGDLRALLEVGRRYLSGEAGFTRHVATGLDHLRAAMAQDAGAASRVIAETLPLHELLQAGEQTALTRAARDGSVPAQLRLGAWLTVSGEPMTGRRWLASAAAAGDADAQRALAAALDAGPTAAPRAVLQALARAAGIVPRELGALAIAAAQAARDDASDGAHAVVRLAGAIVAAVAFEAPGASAVPPALAEALVALVLLAQRHGVAVPDDVEPAQLRDALELRATQGDADAAYLLGRALAGVPLAALPEGVFAEQQNIRKGAAFLLRAADAGCDDAWLHLWRLHADHSLSVANPQMARFFLEKAAQRGLAEAQRKLGALLLRGAQTLAESEQAIAWLHAAAGQGDAHATTLLRTLVLPVPGSEAEANWALQQVRAADPLLAARLALARAFGLTKLEALSVDPVQGLRPWGLVVGRNPFIVQAHLAAPRAVPALDARAQHAADAAAALYGQARPEGDLRNRSLRQRRLFERLGLDEALFFADAGSTTLQVLREGTKWAHHTREPLAHALAA